MSEKSVALARVDSAALAMVMEPTEAVARLRELQAFVSTVMVEGEDYGVLPGSKADRDGNPPRKILLKPGAEKLGEIYGLAVVYTDDRPPIERWDDDPFFAYFKRATITRRSDGLFLGSGGGSCNTREKKYASRWVFERDVPADLDTSRLPRKEGIGKNQRPYVQYRIPNPEIFDLVNTVEKMACKRALVGAVISVTRSSGLFTQDLEDMSAGARGDDRRHAPADVPNADFEPTDRNARPSPPPEPPAWTPADLDAERVACVAEVPHLGIRDARRRLVVWMKERRVPQDIGTDAAQLFDAEAKCAVVLAAETAPP